MAAAAFSPPASRASKVRFTLGGLFVCTFGVGVGLALVRWQMTTSTVRWFLFTNLLLMSAATWIMIGMAQRVIRGVRHFVGTFQSGAAVRRGALLDIGAALGIALCLAISVGAEMAWRLNWPAFVNNQYVGPESQIHRVLFFLALIGAYWVPADHSGDNRPWIRVMSRAKTWALLGIGLPWLGYTLFSWAFIPGLVHFAIRGVELGQPIRWLGRDFYRVNVDVDALTSQFIQEAIFAALLLAAAIVANVLMIRCWRKERRARYGSIVASIGCQLAVFGLVVHCQAAVLPELSPFMAAEVGKQPLGIVAMELALVAAAAAVFSYWQVADSPRGENPFFQSGEATRPSFLDANAGVVIVALFGVLVEIIHSLWWQFSISFSSGMPPLDVRTVLITLVEFMRDAPHARIDLAVAIVLWLWLWRWARCTGNPPASRYIADGRLFFVARLAWTTTLMLAAPVAAWAGSAMMLWYVMP